MTFLLRESKKINKSVIPFKQILMQNIFRMQSRFLGQHRRTQTWHASTSDERRGGLKVWVMKPFQPWEIESLVKWEAFQADGGDLVGCELWSSMIMKTNSGAFLGQECMSVERKKKKTQKSWKWSTYAPIQVHAEEIHPERSRIFSRSLDWSDTENTYSMLAPVLTCSLEDIILFCHTF